MRVITIIIFMFFARILLAQDLQAGMSREEVLRILGAPLQKIQFETKRSEKWIFAGRELIFVEGKLVNLPEAERPTPLPLSKLSVTDHPLPSQPTLVPKRRPAKQISKDLLNEIMQELPDEDGGNPGLPNNPAGGPKSGGSQPGQMPLMGARP